MATRKANWVGNAILHIGPGLDKRKSFPRDSRGFEPLEMYFKRGEEEEEEEESSSDELERQVREKILQKRRLAEEKKRGAAISPTQAPPERLSSPAHSHLLNRSALSPTAASPGLPPRAVPTRLSFSLSPTSPPHTTSHHTSPPHTASHHISPPHTASHHTSSHHTASHHTSPTKEALQSLETDPASSKEGDMAEPDSAALKTSLLRASTQTKEGGARGRSKLSNAHPSRGRGHSKLSHFQLSFIDDSDSDDDLHSLLGAGGPASQLVALSQHLSPPKQSPPKAKFIRKKRQSSKATKKASTAELSVNQTQQRSLSPSSRPSRTYNVSPSSRPSRTYNVSPVKRAVMLQRSGSKGTSGGPGSTPVASWGGKEGVYAFTSDSGGEEPDSQHNAPSVTKGTSPVVHRHPTPEPVQWFVPDDIARTHRAPSTAAESTRTEESRRRASRHRTTGTTSYRDDNLTTDARSQTSAADTLLKKPRKRTAGSTSDGDDSLATGARSQTSAADTLMKKPRKRRTKKVRVSLRRPKKRAHQEEEEEEDEMEGEEEKEEEEEEVEGEEEMEKEEEEEEEVEVEEEGGSASESCAPGVDVILSAGGRRYRRLAVTPRKSHTPGVRRSNRTRIAPVEFWRNEEVEYDTRRLSGAMLKGVRVPMDPPEQRRRRRRKREEEEEPACDNPALRIRVDEATVEEKEVVFSRATSQPVEQEGLTTDGQECLPMYCSRGTANGIMTIAALGEKPCSRTEGYQLFYYVLKGKLLVKIANQEFHLQPQMQVMIPSGMLYSIRNKTHSTAEVFFYTHKVVQD